MMAFAQGCSDPAVARACKLQNRARPADFFFTWAVPWATLVRYDSQRCSLRAHSSMPGAIYGFFIGKKLAS
jgi:hypothetical protein